MVVVSFTADLRRPPTHIPLGLLLDCSNDTRFVSLVEMSFTDPRGGLKRNNIQPLLKHAVLALTIVVSVLVLTNHNKSLLVFCWHWLEQLHTLVFRQYTILLWQNICLGYHATSHAADCLSYYIIMQVIFFSIDIRELITAGGRHPAW